MFVLFFFPFSLFFYIFNRHGSASAKKRAAKAALYFTISNLSSPWTTASVLPLSQFTKMLPVSSTNETVPHVPIGGAYASSIFVRRTLVPILYFSRIVRTFSLLGKPMKLVIFFLLLFCFLYIFNMRVFAKNDTASYARVYQHDVRAKRAIACDAEWTGFLVLCTLLQLLYPTDNY